MMSEEQLRAAAPEATAQVEGGVEEISEEDLEGVAGGIFHCPSDSNSVLGDGTSKTIMVG